MIKTIINRDGTKAKFELWRVETAIEKALHSCTGKDGRLTDEINSGNTFPALSKDLAQDVYSELKNAMNGRVITVEIVQDHVERVLMERGYYTVAKEYILYRERHARLRKQFLHTKSAASIDSFSVVKRNGKSQPMSRDKILKRIRRECEEHEPVLKCDPVVIAEKVAEGVYDGVSTRELDELTITIAKNLLMQDPDYEKLAARIAISGHQKDTDMGNFGIVTELIQTQIAFVAWSLYHNSDQNGDHSPLLQKELYEFILEHQHEIDAELDYERDFNINIFGFQTLKRAYLVKAKTPDFPNRSIVERPQDMFMRVALGIHCVRPNTFKNPSDALSVYEKKSGELIDDFGIAEKMKIRHDRFVPDLKRAFETYHYMSMGYFVHATPTLFYAGTRRPGLSSCFLVSIDDDSIEGIYKSLGDCALISKNAGGIGIHIHKIRANQSYIRGTAGEGNGIVPMLKVYNDTAKYVDQCFAPGTVVHTYEGTKTIEMIKPGELLLTADGNFQPVEKVLEHDYEGEIWILSHGLSFGVKVTPEHQMLALKDYKPKTGLKERLERGYTSAQMYDVKDLLLGDYLVFPVSAVPKEVPEGGFLWQDNLYVPIRSISKEEYSGKVYDFEVAEEHTYVTELGSCHNGGGKRKGAFAVYLACYHADIMEFLELKLPHGQEHLRARDLFYAFWRNDYFMECVLEDRDWYLMCPDECPGLGDVYGEEFVNLYEKYVELGKYRRIIKAREVYQALVKSRVECGVPYIGEKDSINRKSNQSNLGVIQSSNLCVSGDTYILTKQFGQVLIGKVVDQVVDVWNGEEWSETTVRQTGANKDLLKVTLSNGVELNCTPEHRFYIQKAYHTKTPVMIEAKDLPEGCKLIEYDLPTEFEQENVESFPHAYTHGFFSGDGTFEEKKELIEKFGCERSEMAEFIALWSEEYRFTVPMNASNSDKFEWFEGFADANGTFVKNGTGEALQISCIHKDFLIQVRLMLQTLGIDSKISLHKEQRVSIYRLLIDSVYITFNTIHRCTKRNPENSSPQSIRVVKVEDGRKGVDTYCFTEEKRHMGMFNGILTGQCTEIALYSDKHEHGCCNLSSIALPRFVKYDSKGTPYYDFEHLHKVAQIVTRNINNVIDRNYYPTKESERSNYRHRPIGIGVQGLWDVFMMFRYPFGSENAIKLDKIIFETIYHGSLTASNQLAIEEGPYSSFWYGEGCPLSKGKFQFDLWSGDVKPSTMWDWEDLRRKIMKTGVRNSELIAPMPTASTSQILGWTECFEPIKSNLYKRKTSSGEFIVLNKYLYKDIERLGLDVNAVREQIEANDGSVQNIDILPEELKELYKTAWDMDQRLIIDHCAARSPYVTQCCSMNLYFDVVDPEILMNVDIYSWMKGVKTQYYTHSKSLTKAKQHHSDKKSDGKAKSVSSTSDVTVIAEGAVCRMEEGCLMCGS